MSSRPDIEVTPVTPRRRTGPARTFYIVVVVLFLVSRSAWHDIAGAVAHLLTPLGILLAAIGALGRLWCSSYIAGNKNALLVTVGPYSLMRNPLYAFSFVGGLGISITTETLTIPLLFAGWFAYDYRSVISAEEAYLRRVHGTQFEAYRSRVPRFWPHLSQYVEPSRWELSPPAFRRSLTEVVWFVVAAITLHALHDWRDVTALPSLFALY